METEKFQNFINPYITQISSVFHQKSSQFMIVGPDAAILDYLMKHLTKVLDSKDFDESTTHILSTYKTVFVTKQKDFSPDHKIFVLNLELKSSTEYQSLLYYYLELPIEYECFVCLLSTSSQCINMFEKRVMSRFKNKIFYIPFFTNENSEDQVTSKVIENEENKKQKTLEVLSSQTEPISSDSNLEVQRIIRNTQLAQKNYSLALKYNFERYSTHFILDLLQPVHFVLLTIAFNKKLNMKNCNLQFKQAIVNTPELKKTDPVRILYCLFDLLDSRLLNSSGSVLIDIGEFKDYVSKYCPLYIKKLVANYNKLIK